MAAKKKAKRKAAKKKVARKRPARRPAKKGAKKASKHETAARPTAADVPALQTPARSDGRFELRMILLVVAVLAALASFMALKQSRGPADLALAARKLLFEHKQSQLAVGDKRLVIRVKTVISRNHRVWIDLLPAGTFLPPQEGSNDYTVLQHDFGDDQTAVYRPGPWEEALRQTLAEKKK